MAQRKMRMCIALLACITALADARAVPAGWWTYPATLRMTEHHSTACSTVLTAVGCMSPATTHRTGGRIDKSAAGLAHLPPGLH